jgi:hypothetical protein
MAELWLGKQIAMKMRSRKHDVSSGWFWPWREKLGWMVGAALIGGGLVVQHYREERETFSIRKPVAAPHAPAPKGPFELIAHVLSSASARR